MISVRANVCPREIAVRTPAVAASGVHGVKRGSIGEVETGHRLARRMVKSDMAAFVGSTREERILRVFWGYIK